MHCHDKGCIPGLGEFVSGVRLLENVLYYGDISLAVSFSIFTRLLSGPGALLEFRASRCFIMPFSPISRV